MKLSVIIVNYNVKHFLEQCLYSVMEAAKHCETEIFVVDNNSVDGSILMLTEKFPQVKLIENKKNYGFSYANNQAIKQANGEYILLLNPDTLIEEKTFKTVVNFMDSHADAGGLGVKMINGDGDFLPESKRGLPTPKVAFYKIFGLSKLFKKSRKFGQYHLTYLDNDKTHVVDVLSGAFMLLRKSVLDKIGLLDDTFFMYGEDIDLSYRITLAGYKNYYCHETTIIHYKGESTKKGSLNYVYVFYNAMIIFARKHFSKNKAGLFSLLINIAIFFRAGIAILNRFVKAIILPIIDTAVILTGFMIIARIWSGYKFGKPDNYFNELFYLMLGIYTAIWLLSFLHFGGYTKNIKLKNLCKATIFGTLLILVLYSLLPLNMRFSRALILLISIWIFLLVPFVRLLLNFTKIELFKINLSDEKRIAIIGSKEEIQNLTKIINKNNNHIIVSTYIEVNKNDDKTFYANILKQFDEIININKIDEIIFCTKNMQSEQIISTMLKLSHTKVDYKIASSESFSIIGTNFIKDINEFYDISINSISKPENKRNKRLFDFLISFLLIVLSPILSLIIKNPVRMLKNLFSVLCGKLTFVSYSDTGDYEHLPKLKKGLFSAVSVFDKNNISQSAIDKLNMLYAKNYRLSKDFNILIKSWKELGKY